MIKINKFSVLYITKFLVCSVHLALKLTMPTYIHVLMKFCSKNCAQENIVLARTAAKMQVYLEHKIRTAHLTHNPNYLVDWKNKQAMMTVLEK